MGCSTTTKFLALLLVFCTLYSNALSDSISVGISTCTKLDSDGDVKEFICPDSLNIANHYCCGIQNFQHCCDYDTYNAYNTLGAGIIAAIVIGSIIIFAGFVLLLCCCCSCCCLNQRRSRGVVLMQPSTATTIHQPLFVPQGYYQMPSQQTSGQTGPEAMGKPPPYYEP